MLRRLERDTVLVIVGLAAAAIVWRPQDPLLALGVIGGGALIAASYLAIRSAVVALAPAGGDATVPTRPHGAGEGAQTREIRPVSRGFALVKFFTRHAILAFAAYGMMTRLRLDPMGMLIGASAPVIAAALESLRSFRKV